MTTADSKRLSSRTMMPRPRSSANWYFGWHRCCGACVAPLQSRPICFGFRPRSCVTENIDASHQTNRNNGRTCSIASSTLRFPPGPRPRDTERGECNHLDHSTAYPVDPQRQLTYCFQRLANLERRGRDGQNETEQPDHSASLALQLRFQRGPESMGNHDSKIVDASSVG
jgi:hypothetical protein